MISIVQAFTHQTSYSGQHPFDDGPVDSFPPRPEHIDLGAVQQSVDLRRRRPFVNLQQVAHLIQICKTEDVLLTEVDGIADENHLRLGNALAQTSQAAEKSVVTLVVCPPG